MTDPSYFQKHLHFLAILMFYLLPTLIGSVVAFYSRNVLDKDNKNKVTKITSSVVITLFLSALTPSILLAATDTYIRGLLNDDNILIGLSFLVGCMGSEIMGTITSYTKFIKILGKMGDHIDNLKGVSGIAREFEKLNEDITMNDFDKKNSDKKDQ